MELKIYNDRPILKVFIFIFASIPIFAILVALLCGEFDNMPKDLIIIFSIIIGTIAFALITYFLLKHNADSQFVFNEKGITRFHKKKMVLQLDWDKVTLIYHYRTLIDFDKIGPGFLKLEYNDENNSWQMLNVCFSRKDAIKLKESLIHPKLEKMVIER